MQENRPANVHKLQDLVARLRAPDGCPWDREQTLCDLRAYLLEEAHEVAAAIDSGDRHALAGELGDLLFQVVFIAHLAAEEDAFHLGEVVEAVHAKMVRRHPHVFGPAAGREKLGDARAVLQNWERRKLSDEKDHPSLLAGVPSSLPALVTAYRMSQKAAGVGFDWPAAASVLAKIREELAEVETAVEDPDPERRRSRAREEIGDLLFAIANLARHLEIDPEAALAGSNQKFRRRFAAVEAAFRDRGDDLAEATLAQMDAEWDKVKQRERSTPPL